MDKNTTMENLARALQEKDGFNGAWLYAENGEIVSKGAFVFLSARAARFGQCAGGISPAVSRVSTVGLGAGGAHSLFGTGRGTAAAGFLIFLAVAARLFNGMHPNNRHPSAFVLKRKYLLLIYFNGTQNRGQAFCILSCLFFFG